ncbi:hypothetical protein JX266_014574, partial [Neoarthrinium moseri]
MEIVQISDSTMPGVAAPSSATLSERLTPIKRRASIACRRCR